METLIRILKPSMMPGFLMRNCYSFEKKIVVVVAVVLLITTATVIIFNMN